MTQEQTEREKAEEQAWEKKHEELMKKWGEELGALEAEALKHASIPYRELVRETLGYVTAGRKYYPPSAENPDFPHLEMVSYRLPLTVLDEIEELTHWLSYVQGRIYMGYAPKSALKEKLEEAQGLLSNVEAAIDFHLDDDIEEPADEQLARLKRIERRVGQSVAAIAQLLLAYVLLARSLEERLKQDRSFDPNWLERGEALAEELRAFQPPGADEMEQLLDLRDRIYTLLHQRSSLLRRAVNYVFREHVDIRRLFTSAYERRRRAMNRAQQEKPQDS